MTGWNWVLKRSFWLAYDFDSMVGHKEGISESDMEKVVEAATLIPWVTIRKSTSGSGLHLYVALGRFDEGSFVGGVETANHHEHAALGRAILGKMAAAVGFDFQSKIDVLGGNMWVWHRKMLGTDGLTVVKQGEPLGSIPANWRDHLEVVRGRSRRAATKFVVENDVDVFDEMTGTHSQVKLGDLHKKLLDYLEDVDAMAWWDADRHMLVCHTYDLKLAHAKLECRGIFDTSATGKEHGVDQNCFAFPLKHGGWVIRRHTRGVTEAVTWDQDGTGWTRCYFNVDPDLRTAARNTEGVETTKGAWNFQDLSHAVMTLNSLGAYPKTDPYLDRRPASVRTNPRDGRLILEIQYQANDPTDRMMGWTHEGKSWIMMFQVRNKRTGSNLETESLGADTLARHLVDVGNQTAGWVIRAANDEWQANPLSHVKLALKARGYTNKEIDQIGGSQIIESWKLVNLPFQPEFPGNRRWNRDAAQFRFVPSPERDDLQYPTWERVLRHCGTGLDNAVEHNAWCIANGVTSGAEYLTLWVASMFQFPDRPLPYLFLFSPEQDSGKSTLFEAISLLMTKGYCSAEQALTSDSGFNGELANSVLTYIDEFNVAKHKQAYERVKQWTTARYISIRALYSQPYMAVNCTHWIQCANNQDFCPIFPGDTRITVIRVPPIDTFDMIPKIDLIAKLEKEAPDFLRMILDLDIPKSNTRLNIPVITSAEKLALEDKNKSELDKFIEVHCWRVHGHTVQYGEFFRRFQAFFTDAADAQKWTKRKVSGELDINHPIAKISSDPHARYIGNMAWSVSESGEAIPEPEAKPKLVKDGYKLAPVV